MAGRGLYIENETENLSRKLKKEAGNGSKFWLSTSFGKGVQLHGGLPPVLLVRKDGRVKYALEILDQDPREKSRLLMGNVQKIDIPPNKINNSAGSIAQRYGSIDHFLKRFGFDPDNASRDTGEDPETFSGGIDLTESHRNNDINRNADNTGTNDNNNHRVVTRMEPERNRDLSDRLKREYGHKCQVCGCIRMSSIDEPYAEGHHIRPLGEPHYGPDERGNILVLCPNHHNDFDHGLIRIELDRFQISHAYEDAVDSEQLNIHDDHSVEPFLMYHNEKIARI